MLPRVARDESTSSAATEIRAVSQCTGPPHYSPMHHPEPYVDQFSISLGVTLITWRRSQMEFASSSCSRWW